MVNLMPYLPDYWHENLEMQQIMWMDDLELSEITENIELLPGLTFIGTEPTDLFHERWEKPLNISPQGDVATRKEYVLSLLRGTGKLNEKKIKNIVFAITGQDCEVDFSNSTLYIRIVGEGSISQFNTIARVLAPNIPAHIGISINTYTNTWAGVNEDFANWYEVATYGTWDEILKKYP